MLVFLFTLTIDYTQKIVYNGIVKGSKARNRGKL